MQFYLMKKGLIDESGEDYLYSADYFVLVELPTIIKDSVLAVV